MSWQSDILMALKKSSDVFEDYPKVCEVIEVDKVALTCVCSPLDNSPDIVNVLLFPLMNNQIKGQTIFPKLNSKVIVSFLSRDIAYVDMFSEIEEVSIVNQTSYKVVSKNITINGDDYDGMVKIQELTEKLNNLENAYNSLLTQFKAFQNLYNTHVHTGVVSGPSATGITTPVTVDSDNPLTPTQQSEIENPNIKHGSTTEE